jgi:hypothetical protein
MRLCGWCRDAARGQGFKGSRVRVENAVRLSGAPQPVQG